MEITTKQLLNASPQKCFDLARDIDVHVQAGKGISAKVLDGKRHGCAEEGDETLWSARYFGFRFKMRMRIESMDAPNSFVDRKVSGLLATFRHTYSFTPVENNQTLMKDHLEVALPFLPFLTPLFLKRSISRAQNQRFAILKQLAEK